MSDFLNKLTSKQNVVGTFVKTPDPITMEVLALSGLDYVILDAEHAPFGRRELDQCIMTCRLVGLPCIVRVPDSEPATILNAFDCGASGIQLPHVKTAEQAERIVKLSRYGENGRGFAGSTRQANYGTTPLSEHLQNNQDPLVIVQIEDPEGVDNAHEIAAVDGVSALFIGRVDLTVAYNETNPDSGKVIKACSAVCYAGQSANKPVGIFLPTTENITIWQELGVNMYAIASEHAMIIKGFKAVVEDFH